MTDEGGAAGKPKATLGLPAALASPPIAFLALALPFGLAFVVLVPPLDAPDEARHFGRAYSISEGRFGVPGFAEGHGATLPAELLSIHERPPPRSCKHDAASLVAQLSEPLDPDERAGSNRITTQFTPLAYLPQAAAIAFGRGLGLSAAWLLYLGRLANLAAWLAMVAWAIGRAPRRRWFLVALALTPAATALAGAVTADAAMTALAIAFTAATAASAWPARAGEEGTPLAEREVALLLALACAMSLAKPGYWPLAGMLFFIPSDRFRDGRQRWTVLAAAAALVLLPSALWIAWTQRAEPFALGPEADPGAQIRAVLLAPWDFAAVVARTQVIEWIPWTAGFVGVLGRLDVVLPRVVYFVTPPVLIALCWWDDGDPASLAPGTRWRLVALFAGCVATLLAVAYAAWNPVGAPVVADMHGRYFLPLAPLLAFALPARRALPATGVALLCLACAASLGAAVWAVLQRFFAV